MSGKDEANGGRFLGDGRGAEPKVLLGKYGEIRSAEQLQGVLLDYEYCNGALVAGCFF